MDTPTQVVLGAAVGQALFGHRLGRRAAVWGAVGGLIPDLDMIAAAATGAWGEFVLHRGPTHSLFFGLALGPLLGTPAEGAPAAQLSPGPVASVRLAPCGLPPPMGNIRCWKPAPPAMLRSQVAGPEARSTAGVE